MSKIAAIQVALRLIPGRLALLLLVLLLAASCAEVSPRPSSAGGESGQLLREQALALVTDWAFTGRMAITQGNKGGSVAVTWHQSGEDFDVQLAAPITRQSWRLRFVAGVASLDGLDGGPRRGPDPELLLSEATGWHLPLRAMSAWVRGLRAEGPSSLAYDDQGRLASLVQNGWAVEYKAWAESAPALPAKLFARQGEASVRLVIDRWQAP